MDNLLSNAISSIERLSTDAARANDVKNNVYVYHLPQRPHSAFVLRPGLSEPEEIEAPRIRNHELHRVSDIGTLIEALAPEASMIWVDFSDDRDPLGQLAITLVLDDDKRGENRATVRIRNAPEWIAMNELNGWLEPKQLRSKMIEKLSAHYGVGCKDLTTALSKVRFASGKVLTSDSSRRGNESLDASMTAEVSGLQEMPEFVFFKVRPFHDPLMVPREVCCMVDIDAPRGLIRLVPLQSGVESAIQTSLDLIQNHLREIEKAVVLRGTP
jgi:hypothetical protein